MLIDIKNNAFALKMLIRTLQTFIKLESWLRRI